MDKDNYERIHGTLEQILYYFLIASPKPVPFIGHVWRGSTTGIGYPVLSESRQSISEHWTVVYYTIPQVKMKSQ